MVGRRRDGTTNSGASLTAARLKGFGGEGDATIGVGDGVVEGDGAVEVGIRVVDVRAISIRGDGTAIGGETADGELTLFWIGEA